MIDGYGNTVLAIIGTGTGRCGCISICIGYHSRFHDVFRRICFPVAKMKRKSLQFAVNVFLRLFAVSSSRRIEAFDAGRQSFFVLFKCVLRDI